MQISRIYLSEDEMMPDKSDMVFALSGVVSEWLFASMFWSEFNEKNGTIFDIYEEDDASPMVCIKLSLALGKRIATLLNSTENDISFVFRWCENGEPIWCNVQKDVLVKELSAFRDCLLTYGESGQPLWFSL
jgi:hypothetical protein